MDIVQYIYHGPNKLYTSDGSCTQLVCADDDYDSETGDSFHPSAWEERLKRRQIQFDFDETSLQEHVRSCCSLL